MWDWLALIIFRLKPLLFIFVKAAGMAVFIATMLLIFELYLLPQVTGSAWVKKLGILPKLAERTTVVERQETVMVTQEENVERLAVEHSSVVVRLVALPEPADTSRSLTQVSGSRSFLGTLVTNDGFLVTYAERPPQTEVRYLAWLSDGTKAEAHFSGYDTLTNLAYFQVIRDNTSAASFANMADIKSGRRVVLLGLSQDGQLSVAPTTVERLERTFNLSPQTVASSEKWEGVFALAAGADALYEGGPAFLVSGDMAGVVGTRSVDTQKNVFLIPAKVVRESLDRIVAGRGVRPTAGIYYLSLTAERAALLGLNQTEGALVYSPSGRTGLSVLAGSPADRAGILYGDIILAVDGVSITLDNPLSVALGKIDPGRSAILTILRGSEKREVTLAL